ncbi:MAG: hypothetical protein WA435_14310 [Gallionellaceae bacterium]
MKNNFNVSTLLSSLIAASIFALALPASAQMNSDMMAGKKGVAGSAEQQMSGMTHDMADQMMDMSRGMSQGNMNAMQQKQMGERMGKMGSMMNDLSVMMGKGMMMDADNQKRMDQMRKQMEELMHSGASMTK